MKPELLRALPKMDLLLARPALAGSPLPYALRRQAARQVLDEYRAALRAGALSAVPGLDELEQSVLRRGAELARPALGRVINATGVVLHTNLGRAPLSPRAAAAVGEAARGYSNLEYDLSARRRGRRGAAVESLLCALTGAEAALVVNNNAAAVFLLLSALAAGRGVAISRGELVEIGGSFRVPEIMEQSGAKLMDVGTTNKTKPSDYLNAYHEGETGALMKVHTSNYRILGFTQEVELPEMVELGKKLNLPVIYDMGSGLMADLTECGVDEPTVLDALKTGIDVILFSGDKLLGGPQGGIIAGKKEYIDKMKAHPLARAFRVDKMTLAAMEATFFEYSDIRQARKTIPVLNMITTPAAELKDKAERLAGEIRRTTHNFTVEVEACKDQVGGGSAPTVLLDGYAVAVQGKTLAPEKIERLLRREEIPIIVRITHNQVYLDVRTIREDEFEYIVAAFTAMDSRQVEG